MLEYGEMNRAHNLQCNLHRRVVIDGKPSPLLFNNAAATYGVVEWLDYVIYCKFVDCIQIIV